MGVQHDHPPYQDDDVSLRKALPNLDAATAIELAARRHLDGFVIDCDDIPGGRDVLRGIRNSRSNKLSVVFAVVNGTTSVSTTIEAGANFVLGKPVQYASLSRFFDIALPGMQREHRRYFRYKVELSVEVVQTGETFAIIHLRQKPKWLGAMPTLRVYVFSHIELESRVHFRAWLDKLDAQLQFRESA